ncbi:hypothetical protein EYF80_004247 [Liparis tanakae]|uniref:Uncharacterized protein n=1 Tax=Liparis tanakae TaxID=230148 RepID=A0A4Z2J6T6_9TELE|nr:hypothetical protein EYF80_004247 [Liparis tanakae]
METDNNPPDEHQVYARVCRDTEIYRYGLRWLGWLGLCRWAARLPFRAGGAVRVLRIHVAAGALKKLEEILLYGSFPTR